MRLVMPKLGVPVEPSRVEAVEPWWRSVLATGAAPKPVVGALGG